MVVGGGGRLHEGRGECREGDWEVGRKGVAVDQARTPTAVTRNGVSVVNDGGNAGQ